MSGNVNLGIAPCVDNSNSISILLEAQKMMAKKPLVFNGFHNEQSSYVLVIAV